jgi:metal-dependent amidase/aminoacylase/carboxypeptidase family protein
MFHAGSATNVISSNAEMSASIRTFDPEIRTLIERRIREICKGMETMHGVNIDLDYENGYPPTINHDKEAAEAIEIARELVGENMINEDIPPVMGGEDFSYMLEARPGAFLWIGGGKTDNDPGLHHPEYDFNDDVLTLGSSYWAKLVETRLAKPN